MYCPVCLNPSLGINSQGVADLLINKKQLDSGKILFYAKTGPNDTETIQMLEKKMQEFFIWYSKFLNIEPIVEIEILSNSFSCVNKCKLPVGCRFSLIGILFTAEQILATATKLGLKYKIPVVLKEKSSPNEKD